MKDWQRKNSKQRHKRIGALVSASLALFVLNTTVVANAVAAERDYENWYQVEIVIFAQKNAAFSDESWALENLSYPNNMLSISPTSDDLIEPLSLQQLSDIISHEQLAPANSLEQFETTDDYLFSSRRRQPIVVDNDRDSDSARSASQYNTTTEVFESGQLLSGEAVTPLELSEADLNQLFSRSEPIAYKELNPTDNDLDRLVRSINRSTLYRLLTHKSWRQPVVDEKNAAPILIQAGHHYDDLYEIDGTIKLSRSRFLHFSTDLWYTEFSPLYNTSNSSIEAPQVLDIDPALAKAHPKVVQWENNRNRYLPIHSHPLKQSRRMRSETLHFIDHPYFGILVSVKSFEYAAEDLQLSLENSN